MYAYTHRNIPCAGSGLVSDFHHFTHLPTDSYAFWDIFDKLLSRCNGYPVCALKQSRGIPDAREVVVVDNVLLLFAVLKRLVVVILITVMLLAFILLLVVVVALVPFLIMLQW